MITNNISMFIHHLGSTVRRNKQETYCVIIIIFIKSCQKATYTQINNSLYTTYVWRTVCRQIDSISYNQLNKK